MRLRQELVAVCHTWGSTFTPCWVLIHPLTTSMSPFGSVVFVGYHRLVVHIGQPRPAICKGIVSVGIGYPHVVTCVSTGYEELSVG